MGTSLNYIISQVQGLVDKLHTRNPLDICDALGIQVLYDDLQRKLKGYYFCYAEAKVVVIDNNVIPLLRPLLIAHELGHATLHTEIAMMRGFQETDILSIDQPMEYEANLFAAELCLEDDEVIRLLHDYTFFETARILNVPIALLDLKFELLKHKGYGLHRQYIAPSDFLKDDIGAYENDSGLY